MQNIKHQNSILEKENKGLKDTLILEKKLQNEELEKYIKKANMLDKI